VGHKWLRGRGRPPIGDEASSAYSVLPIGRIIQSARVTTIPGDVGVTKHIRPLRHAVVVIDTDAPEPVPLISTADGQ
jgi:hypothetical protein